MHLVSQDALVTGLCSVFGRMRAQASGHYKQTFELEGRAQDQYRNVLGNGAPLVCFAECRELQDSVKTYEGVRGKYCRCAV